MKSPGRWLTAIWISVATLSPGPAPADTHPQSRVGKSLQAKAADPTEPLVQVSLFNDLAIENHRGDGAAYQLLFQPVAPVPRLDWFPFAQIIRPSIPFIASAGPNRVEGLGDISLFDLILPERFSWGALGVGPALIFPSATDDRLGSEKWQVGPAAALIYEAIPQLQFGVILQNPISFAGNSSRLDVNQLIVQPILQYNLPRGWYVSMGDFNWIFDWEDSGDAAIPLALQAGRVMPIFGQQWNLSIEPFYTVTHAGPGADWGFRFGISLLLPE